MQDWLVPLDAIVRDLEETPEGKRFHYPIRHGSMRVGVYAPRGPTIRNRRTTRTSSTS